MAAGNVKCADTAARNTGDQAGSSGAASAGRCVREIRGASGGISGFTLLQMPTVYPVDMGALGRFLRRHLCSPVIVVFE
ncbi:MAG: hypothetical protein QF541_10405, partial [Lentisphaeria bacterium]|jgi:hypothetical protein|nr:hypothetical protein [Lentisphaeria bacterium]